MAAKKHIQRMLEEQNQLKHKVARYEVTKKKKDRDIDEILTKGAQAAAGDSSGAPLVCMVRPIGRALVLVVGD